MLGRADGISARRIHDDNAFPRGGWDVDVIDASSGATDNLEARRGIDDFLWQWNDGFVTLSSTHMSDTETCH